MKIILAKDLKVGDIIKDMPKGSKYVDVVTFQVAIVNDQNIFLEVLEGNPKPYIGNPYYTFPREAGLPWYQY